MAGAGEGREARPCASLFLRGLQFEDVVARVRAAAAATVSAKMEGDGSRQERRRGVLVHANLRTPSRHRFDVYVQTVDRDTRRQPAT